MDYFTYGNIGAYDDFILPQIDLTSSSNPALAFYYAYTTFGISTYNDSLKVLVSADCGLTNTSVFYKGGNDLITVPAMNSLFTPHDSSEWESVIISLSQFIGQKVLITFRGINAYGNNLYVDNINIFNSNLGLNENSLVNNDFKIYPNPFQNLFQFTSVVLRK